MRRVERIVEHLADKYLKWWKHTSDGKNINGACPFHSESSEGAFYMSTLTGVFICHSCQVRGSLSTFLREIGAPSKLRVSIMEQVGPELHEQAKIKSQNPYVRDPFKKHMPLKESLLGVFDFCPVSLVEKGFDQKVLQKYDVGFDKTALRITFPIRNHLGVLMGIAGRTVVGEKPRYKIYKADDLTRFSPDYRGYHFEKKNFLWNMHNVYPEAAYGDLDNIFIVEGYKAALWLIQHGAWNVVALMGTYMSTMQRTLIQRLAVDVCFLLDNSDLAEKGVYEAGMMLRRGHKVFVCQYPESQPRGSQPDDLDHQELVETLQNPEPFTSWRIEYERHVRSATAQSQNLQRP